MARRVHISARMGFEERAPVVKLSDLRPLKHIGEEVKKSAKYAQILASVSAIGLVDPPVVARTPSGSATS